MRYPLAIIVALLVATTGCGTEIGDSCSLSSDCSSQGDRFCDTTSPGGYCTVIGCDYDNCPDDSVCIRFFSTTQTNIACDPTTEDNFADGIATTDTCSPDELCTLTGVCMPRTAEFRFCMQTCDGGGDCRDGYECRDEAKMILNGGEPVLKPGARITDDTRFPKFCAAEPVPQ